MRCAPLFRKMLCAASAALLSAAVPSPSLQTCAAESYAYFDDFSSDAAMSDSYLHSPLVLEPPEITLDGVLMYGPGIAGRSLYFYDGFWVDAWALLYYRFPLDDSVTGISDGAVSFDVWGHTHPGGALRLAVSFEGADGGFAESITEYGHHEYSLSPSEPCEAVLVDFEGGYMMIDNLAVVLHGSTAVSAGTWSAIKALFRDRGCSNGKR